jgi:thiosulfate/3-mercaptopyruvate sulfurtransferase
MNTNTLLIEPDELEHHLSDPDVVIVDLCKPTQYQQAHLPGARFVSYGDIVRVERPVAGLLPGAAEFSVLVSSLGITADKTVVAYDDEGGGCAARFIWTLYVYGHEKAVLLNGGLHSWANEGHTLSTEIPAPVNSKYTLSNTGHYTAECDYILGKLNDDHTALLDARTLAEFTGEKKFAERGGHIPGAKRYEWTNAMDRNHNYRLLPADSIQPSLDALGITKDKEVIVYCQTHHRSAYSWLMLRALGYEEVKGYPGSWSDWGNRVDTPVEV